MVKPMITLNNRFFWNLTANVGRNCPNNLDDVELVRYGYFCYAKDPGSNKKLWPVIEKMSTTGGYGPDLQQVIDQHQINRGLANDGHVSVIKHNFNAMVGGKFDGKHLFILLILNNNMWTRTGQNWPRIDQAAETGSEITRVVKEAFGEL